MDFQSIVVDERLAPGVKDALHQRVKRNAKGRPTQKLTQFLTPEEGKPQLERLLEGVILLMRMSNTWPEFRLKLDEYYPRLNETKRLPLLEDKNRVVRQFEQLHLLATASHSPPPFCPSLSPTSAGRQRTGKT